MVPTRPSTTVSTAGPKPASARNCSYGSGGHGVFHRQHDKQGAPLQRRRKRGARGQATGRSRAGRTTKTRVRADETALLHRKEDYNFLILAEWMEHSDNEACIALAREIADQMRQFLAPARYVNCLGDDETSDALAAADGLNYRCLQSIKTQYGLTNFIRMNQNIAPLVRRP